MHSFDPVYSDARARAVALGEFNFFSAWMSQPKSQLETFRAWAGKDSDIRYASLSREPVPLSTPYLSALPSSC
jgi:D-galacturonate reductase